MTLTLRKAGRGARNPYFLYAASNLGSLAALLGYPALVEPRLGLHAQGRGWTLGYVLLLALVAATARVVWKAGADGKERMGAAEAEPPAVSPSPSAGARLRWVAYSFVPASLMMGVTLFLTTDKAAEAAEYCGLFPREEAGHA